MTCEAYLNYCIDTYYSKILIDKNFKLTESKTNSNFSFNIFTSKYYILKLTCDQQIIEAEIASLYNKEKFLYINDLNIYTKVSSSKKTNAWDLKMLVAKTLTAEEQIEFLNTNHELITKILDKENIETTIKNIQNSTYKKYNFQK